jgi:hypothetical protein
MMLAMAFVAGCYDMFSFSMAKRLPGGYELLKWEDNVTYYLTAPGKHEENGCGAIEGTVLEIGWTLRHVVAKRHSCFRGDPDGWMIVDTTTHNVSGPMTEAQLRANDDVKHIDVHSAAVAWSDRLPCFTKRNDTWAPWFRGCVAPWEKAGR